MALLTWLSGRLWFLFAHVNSFSRHAAEFPVYTHLAIAFSRVRFQWYCLHCANLTRVYCVCSWNTMSTKCSSCGQAAFREGCEFCRFVVVLQAVCFSTFVFLQCALTISARKTSLARQHRVWWLMWARKKSQTRWETSSKTLHAKSTLSRSLLSVFYLMVLFVVVCVG